VFYVPLQLDQVVALSNLALALFGWLNLLLDQVVVRSSNLALALFGWLKKGCC
jgi:hypothetical protein